MARPKVFVAGHQGMVGSALVRLLTQQAVEIVTATRDRLDLANQVKTHAFLQEQRVDQVYLAAAKVGGIFANNQRPAEFIYENLIIESNVIHSAWQAGVQKLLFLGSSCIYPRLAPQPITEESLLNGALEPTNEPYAIAKIAGIKLCESYNRQYGTDYRSVMPTNLYGPNDNFHPANSHVIPALIRRFHEAKMTKSPAVTIWGSGSPRREFLHVDDLAEACLHVQNIPRETYDKHVKPMLSHINVGTGTDCTIRELATMVATVVGYSGDIVYDDSKPDGTPRKLLDVGTLTALGWKASTPLKPGLRDTYQWFLAHQASLGSFA